MKHKHSLSFLVFILCIFGTALSATAQSRSTANRGWLGVGLEALSEEEQSSLQLDFPAVRVRKVYRDSPAMKAGVELGDLVLRVGQQPIRTGVQQMVSEVQKHQAGQEVSFLFVRKGVEMEKVIPLDAFPDTRALLENEWKGRAFPNLVFESLQSGESVVIPRESGRYVLLDYWATWCGPCRLAAVTLDELRHRISEQTLFIAGISTEERAIQEVYQRNNPAPYPLWIDKDKLISSEIGAGSLPTFILIGPDGNVLRMGVGLDGLKSIESELDSRTGKRKS